MPKIIQRDEELDFKPLDEIIESAKAEGLGLIPILQRAQEHYGYLPKPLLEAIADKLSSPIVTSSASPPFMRSFT